MASIFSFNKNIISPKPGQRIIKASEAAEYYEASSLVEAWRSKAEELDRNAAADRKKLKETAYAEGREEGRREYTEKILDTVFKSLEYIEGLETSMVKVVTGALRKIIGDMDDDERIVRQVRQALNAVRNEKRVLVRVALQDEAAVLSDLASRVEGNAGSGYFEVVADPRLKRGECFLETEMGVVEASLETQLQNLESALLKHVRGVPGG